MPATTQLATVFAAAYYAKAMGNVKAARLASCNPDDQHGDSDSDDDDDDSSSSTSEQAHGQTCTSVPHRTGTSSPLGSSFLPATATASSSSSTASAAGQSSAEPNATSSLSKGGIAGIIIALLIVAGLAFLALLAGLRRRRRARTDRPRAVLTADSLSRGPIGAGGSSDDQPLMHGSGAAMISAPPSAWRNQMAEHRSGNGMVSSSPDTHAANEPAPSTISSPNPYGAAGNARGKGRQDDYPNIRRTSTDNKRTILTTEPTPLGGEAPPEYTVSSTDTSFAPGRF